MPLTTAPRTRLGPHATPMAPWGAFTGKTVTTDIWQKAGDEAFFVQAEGSIRVDESEIVLDDDGQEIRIHA